MEIMVPVWEPQHPTHGKSCSVWGGQASLNSVARVVDQYYRLPYVGRKRNHLLFVNHGGKGAIIFLIFCSVTYSCITCPNDDYGKKPFG
jgi:hypothetical protein